MPVSETTPSHLIPLKVEDCPLLVQADRERCLETIAAYNAVLAFYQRLQQDVAADEWDKIKLGFEKSLQKVHDRLTRRRYQVGLLGPFQGGKSTAFNRLLKVQDPNDAPSKEGDANATTATITRVVAAAGAKHQLYLRYLLEAEYQKRLNDLCLAVEIPPGTEQDITAQINEALKTTESHDEDRLNALRFLQRFVLSGSKYRKDKLRATAQERLVEIANWDDRSRLLNHPPKEERVVAAPNALLESAQISYLTSFIPPELELIDLPGLGAVNSFDDSLTLAYVQHLDGAFVFSKADAIQDRNVSNFLTSLKNHGGSLEGRVWLFYSKSDMIGPAHFRGNYFANVATFAAERRLPLNQIGWLCNTPHFEVKAENRQQAALQSGDAAALAPAWEALFDDGGFARLSRLILEEVPQRVGQGILRQADEDLSKLARDLGRLARKELANGAGNGEDELSFVQGCLNSVSKINVRVATDPQWLAEAADELKQELNAAFEKLNIDAEVLDHSGKPGKNFKQHSNRMEAALHRYLRNELTGRAYQEILPQLQDVERLERMRLPDIAPEGLSAAWEGFQAEDELNVHWHAPDLPSFVHHDPFSGLTEDPLTGQDYVGLFNEKVQIVSRQSIQKLRRRMQDRLQFLEHHLDQFANRSTLAADKSRSADFEQIVQAFCEKFAIA